MLLCVLAGCTPRSLAMGPAPDAADGGAPQGLVVDVASLNIEEGQDGTIGVWLAVPPAGPLTVSIQNSNPSSLPTSASSLVFTPDNYAIAQRITVHAIVDDDVFAHIAEITFGAPGLSSLHVAVTSSNVTQIDTIGWSQPFATYSGVRASAVTCYQLHVEQSATLQSFGLYAPVAPHPGEYAMALYTSDADKPGTLVGAMAAASLIDGTNLGPVADTALPAGDMWLCLHVAQVTVLGHDLLAKTNVLSCVRDNDIGPSETLWPSLFGSASCGPSTGLWNLWISARHQ